MFVILYSRRACKTRNPEYGITEYGINFILYLTHTTRNQGIFSDIAGLSATSVLDRTVA